MRLILLFTVFMFSMAGLAMAELPSPDSFATKAEFAVDERKLSLSSAIATIEPRLGAPGYSWVRIYFYSFLPAAEDMAGIAIGDVKSMDKKWTKLADKQDGSYNLSQATIQLSVDKDFKVWQADMSIPGYSCTIAPFEKDVKNFLQAYQFDGKKLKLKSKGSFFCDLIKSTKPVGNFSWDIDLDTPVFEKRNPL